MGGLHIHVHMHQHADKETKEALNSIIQKLDKMSPEIQELKESLQAANQKADKVAADVTALHAKIDGIENVPTAEEWAEVKQLSNELNNKLQAVDDQTPDSNGKDNGGTPA